MKVLTDFMCNQQFRVIIVQRHETAAVVFGAKKKWLSCFSGNVFICNFMLLNVYIVGRSLWTWILLEFSYSFEGFYNPITPLGHTFFPFSIFLDLQASEGRQKQPTCNRERKEVLKWKPNLSELMPCPLKWNCRRNHCWDGWRLRFLWCCTASTLRLTWWSLSEERLRLLTPAQACRGGQGSIFADVICGAALP